MEDGRGVHKLLVGNLMERDHWGDKYVGGRIILRWIFRLVLVNTVMNFRVPSNVGNFLISCKTS